MSKDLGTAIAVLKGLMMQRKGHEKSVAAASKEVAAATKDVAFVEKHYEDANTASTDLDDCLSSVPDDAPRADLFAAMKPVLNNWTMNVLKAFIIGCRGNQQKFPQRKQQLVVLAEEVSTLSPLSPLSTTAH